MSAPGGIPANDPYPRRRVEVEGTTMAYVDTGSGRPVVFLHGNPTSSYLWRNVIPHVEGVARCLAPDLVGMGESGKAPDGSYRFGDHAAYLDAWFDALALDGVVLVGHDWGGALALHWASRHADRVAGIAYMETILAPLEWEDWPEGARKIFQAMRSPAGEEIVLGKNVFVERILPSSVLRDLTDEEMERYRAPYREAGEVRRPTLTWPREIPIAGEPPDMVETAEAYGRWAAASEIPKLFIDADPGSILVGRQREICRRWPNQREVTVRGAHFIQEDSPAEIGRAVAELVREIEANVAGNPQPPGVPARPSDGAPRDPRNAAPGDSWNAALGDSRNPPRHPQSPSPPRHPRESGDPGSRRNLASPALDHRFRGDDGRGHGDDRRGRQDDGRGRQDGDEGSDRREPREASARGARQPRILRSVQDDSAGAEGGPR